MKPKWKIKDKIYTLGIDHISITESWGWTYRDFCQMAKWSGMTVSEYVDFFNETIVPVQYYEIYPDFDLPNPHLHLKDKLPKQYHKLVDDLNIQNTKAIIAMHNTMTSFDLMFWQEIHHKEYTAKVRIQMYLQYIETKQSQTFDRSDLYAYGTDAKTINQVRLKQFKQHKLDKNFEAADKMKVLFNGFVLYEGKDFSELILDDRFYHVKKERSEG